MITSRKTSRWFFIWDERTIIEGDLSRDAIPQRRIKVAWEAYNYCEDQLRSIDFIKNNPWFKDRYMQVTHRELSLKPIEVAEKVYNFMGQHLDDKIREHLLNLTEAKSEGYKNRRGEALNLFRNTTYAINRWKDMPSNYVKFWDIVSIEEQCKKLFKYLRQPFTGDVSSRYLQLIERGD